MIKQLSLTQKISRVQLAIKIIEHSSTKGVSLAKASKTFKKDKRFIYDVNRRLIIKNPKGVPKELIEYFKNSFSPKTLIYKKNITD